MHTLPTVKAICETAFALPWLSAVADPFLVPLRKRTSNKVQFSCGKSIASDQPKNFSKNKLWRVDKFSAEFWAKHGV